jgi:hypothetical protein
VQSLKGSPEGASSHMNRFKKAAEVDDFFLQIFYTVCDGFLKDIYVAF